MKPQSLLIAGALAVAVIAVLAVLLPGLSAPPSPGPGEGEPAPVPTPTPAPVPENGTYVNATYGYALTCPEGWLYTESGESVWFSSPVKHEEVRVNAIPLSGGNTADTEKVLLALNETYAKDLAAGIDARWVSTERISLDGSPGYMSAFSAPINDEDDYTFIARYTVRNGTLYSVMHTVFPAEYDIYNADAAPLAESFRFI
ncbi:hypothetical protein F8E02_00605 [Methanoculleus sp. Wushi-C6]|uniref:PsbP C-terminal domain-containing protein n=1 Tax=Methanoculleus caldifontis TaxID=2651577 RepID=A0ABU3WXM1_9EURY|nr:PsbP-related protein [Methanoculleus sp. Wushi-C6]MDV2480528.1 hypothetical protein [Methanoculleus sp. Wushi-C6]